MYFNVYHLFCYIFIPLTCLLLYIYVYIFNPYGPLSEIKNHYYIITIYESKFKFVYELDNNVFLIHYKHM